MLSLGISLSTLISQLDTTASDIIANQRDSLVQRKDLAQKTKEFRKLEDAEKLTEWKSLLKGKRIGLRTATNAKGCSLPGIC
jgi:homeobox protein cut-like